MSIAATTKVPERHSQAQSQAAALPPTSEIRPKALASLAINVLTTGHESDFKHALNAAIDALAILPNNQGGQTHALWMIAADLAQANRSAEAREMIAGALKNTPIDPTEVAFQVAPIAAGLTKSEGLTSDLSWIEKLPTTEAKVLAYTGAASGLLPD